MAVIHVFTVRFLARYCIVHIRILARKSIVHVYRIVANVNRLNCGKKLFFMNTGVWHRTVLFMNTGSWQGNVLCIANVNRFVARKYFHKYRFW